MRSSDVHLRFLARPYFWIWFLPLAVATGIAFLAVRNDAAELMAAAGLLAMAGPCIAVVLFLRRRNLWQQTTKWNPGPAKHPGEVRMAHA